MKSLGWGLIVAAVFLHFLCCEWHETGYHKAPAFSPVFPWLFPSDHFAYEYMPAKQYRPKKEYHAVTSGILGLVIPSLMIGGGVGLVMKPVKRFIDRNLSK